MGAGVRAAGGALATAAALSLASCGAVPAGADREVVLLGASSLRGVLDDVARGYEAAHPEVDVVVATAGSPAVAAQVRAGAPADLVVLADEALLDRLRADGSLTGPSVVVARTALALVVPVEASTRVDGLADLTRPDVRVALGGPDVPVGRYARQALTAAGLRVEPAGEEPDVAAVLGRVASGEADAGVVYATDVALADGRVRQVSAPELERLAVALPAARVAGGDPAAEDVLDWLQGPDGRAVLTRAGFEVDALVGR